MCICYLPSQDLSLGDWLTHDEDAHHSSHGSSSSSQRSRPSQQQAAGTRRLHVLTELCFVWVVWWCVGLGVGLAVKRLRV